MGALVVLLMQTLIITEDCFRGPSRTTLSEALGRVQLCKTFCTYIQGSSHEKSLISRHLNSSLGRLAHETLKLNHTNLNIIIVSQGMHLGTLVQGLSPASCT